MGRHWVDALTSWLAESNEDLELANLATPGATSNDVLAHQLPALERFEPELVTVVCGVNDVLLADRPDISGYAGRLEQILRLARGARDAVVVTATCPDRLGALPLNTRVRIDLGNAIDLLNEATRSAARRGGVPCVELGRHAAPTLETTEALATAFASVIAQEVRPSHELYTSTGRLSGRI